MATDDDMLDDLPTDDIGSQHYQWSVSSDLCADLAHYFIIAYEQHCKNAADNIIDGDYDNDALFLTNWDVQGTEKHIDIQDIIAKNPMGVVIIDPNEHSLLQSQIVPIGQQPTKPKTLKRAPPPLSLSRPTPSSSKPTAANKKSRPTRHLRSKDPNV